MKKREILQYAKVLFANNATFNFPAVFANRTDSRAFVMERIRTRDKRVILISDILGSGKTFLLNMVVNELRRAQQKTLSCAKLDLASLGESDLIVVDEWDIKVKPKIFRQSLEMLAAALQNHAGTTILLGDYTLRSSGVREALGGPDNLIETPMEGLNPKFFNLALQNRIAYVRGNASADDVAEIDREIVVPLLAEALVPEWKVTSANFRDVFLTLSQLCEHLGPSTEDGAVGAEEAKDWVAARAPKGMSEVQTAFFANYIVGIREKVQAQGWSSIAPMTLEELRQYGSAGLSDEAFREEVIEPLWRAPGLIAAMGTPEVSASGDSYDRFPGPYLPGVYARLSIAFGE
jgi:hypothetical protein